MPKNTYEYSTPKAMEQRIEEVRPQLQSFVEFPEVPGPKERPAYGRIAFEGLPNTRDLGGLVGKDGRLVKHGLLLRSGTLGYFGTEADIARLRDEYDLRLDVDLRNDTEISENPDPLDLLPNTRYVHANILTDETVGITQEKEAVALRRIRESEEEPDHRQFMKILYPYLLLERSGIEGYQAFLQALLDCEQGAALWHCSVGRDRCGMASVLIESILGVAWHDIENDYLATNIYAPADITRDGMASLMSINAARESVEREFGGFLGYAKDALGVSDSEIKILQDRYLE